MFRPAQNPAAAVALAILCLWAYWPTVADMAEKWWRDPQYSHGYLVPVFACALLWLRRGRLAAVEWQPHWAGVLFLGAGLLLRGIATYFYFDWLDGLSLLPCLAGICVLCGGYAALRWTWPAIAFLAFMVPLPYRIETALAHPLQRVATMSSAYTLQTLGLPALPEGNTIILSRSRIGVVEACGGLSMMLIFVALAAALAIVVRRPPLDRALIVLSAFPIALVANVARITATGIAQETAGPEVAEAFFHDWAGWLMMPLGLLLLWGVLWLLSLLLVAPPPKTPLAVSLPETAVPARPARKDKRKPKEPKASVSPARTG